MSSERIELEEVVPQSLDGSRFDQAAAQMFPDYSRSRLQGWIKEGELTVDGRTLRPRDKLEVGQTLSLQTSVEPEQRFLAEDIALDIVFEDDDIMVINKPAGLVVHPAAGHAQGTLLNALLHHCPAIDALPRAGIVHRLDKDTTGLMVVAKSLIAHHNLVNQLQERSVSRQYAAVVQGVVTGGGSVEEAIGRHPKHRQKMAVVDESVGKYALTHYRVITRYRAHTLINCQLETGRTHQIRVHMAHIRYPLLGDSAYAGRAKIPKGGSVALIDAIRNFPRQALHAQRLGLVHPGSEEYLEWEAPLPADMTHLIDCLEADLKNS